MNKKTVPLELKAVRYGETILIIDIHSKVVVAIYSALLYKKDEALAEYKNKKLS